MSTPTTPLLRAGLAAAALLLGASAAAAREEAEKVAVSIESPAPGTVVEELVHQARITGSAAAALEHVNQFDVMLAIDVSESTKAASGADVDRDGAIGVNPVYELLPPGAFPPGIYSTDAQDTVLAAEIVAAKALLESLDPRRVRVGVLTFAGEVDPTTGRRKRLDQEDAWLEVPLSSDYAHVRRALDAILARGANGATNYAAGLRLAIAELAGVGGMQSTPRPGARKVVLFLTDGMPTLPIGLGNQSDPGDVEAAVRAAELAHKAGITVNTYAMGTRALEYPKAATEIARVTLGTYTPVQRPGDIVALLQGISFANVEDVVFTNLSTGDLSTDVHLAPDGGFDGFVPVREGTNRVRVTALASDGSTGAVEFDLEFRVGGQSEQDRRIELRRLQQMGRELMLETERRRIDDFREQQRKELLLRAEKKEGEAEPTR